MTDAASPPLDLKADLIARATAYCAGRDMSMARLATIVANDGKFFTRLAAGGGMTTRMYERFIAYFAANPASPPPQSAAPVEGAAA